MEWISKKASIWTFVSLYAVSYILQSFFFVDRKKVYAAETTSLTNIVAVLVDKDIYPENQEDIQWYTTQYIQKKLNNTKAIVLPINIKNIKAFEISKMLENIYFDGIKDEPSKLIWTVLIGNIPLPVIQDNGYMYPSIFPYVDFEKQQFVFDQNKNFFVPNNNPNGQAEIWHGIINFSSGSAYRQYFQKLKTYYQNPEKFVDAKIWYDDLIGTKQLFVPENINYYINSQIFAEDRWYHRYTNLLFNTLKDEHNTTVSSIGSTLENDLKGAGTGLENYGKKIQTQQNQGEAQIKNISTKIPTSLLSKSIKEITKTYDGIINNKMLAKMKENISSAARRYKQDGSGKIIDDINSHYEKISQKDSWILGNEEVNTQPLLIQFNTALETELNSAIEQKKYYMDIPMPISYLNFAGERKRGRCIWPTYNYFQNYYFWQDANSIKSAQDISIFKWTYQNLSSLSGQQIKNDLQSVGGSYKVFSTQVEANRGYNFNNTQQELNLYNTYKTNTLELRKLNCTKYLFGRKWLGICIRKRVWIPDNSEQKNRCYPNDPDNQWGCETLAQFSRRNRWGASPLNLDMETNTLKNFDYRNSKQPIYDIAWSRATSQESTNNNSYLAMEKYTNLIQNKFWGKAIQTNSSLNFLINTPYLNGNTLLFANVLPQGDLESPSWILNMPKTYAQTNFFTKFSQLPSKQTSGNKAVLYNKVWGQCWGAWEIYTYKTIDSRVKNIAPTWDQISSYQGFRFKNGSALENFYTTLLTDLSRKKQEIADINSLLITNNGGTGISDNFLSMKSTIQEYNNALHTIETLQVQQLSGYTTGQIHTLANTWTQENITPQVKSYISGLSNTSIQELEFIGDYLFGFNLNTSRAACDGIKQGQAMKNDIVELLTSRKTNITTNLNYIQSNANTVKNSFVQAKNIYQTIPRLEDKVSILQIKKSAINALQSGNGWPYGCSNKYKELCDTLDTIKSTLSNDRVTINQHIDNIQSYNEIVPGESTSTNMPLQDIQDAIDEHVWTEETTEIGQIVGWFGTSNDTEKKDVIKGINITTADRPIDNIRNITFQGIGGSKVQLNYPNLYEVPVYTKTGDKLILKSAEDIRSSIKTYMIQRIQEYNTLLQEQSNKKNAFYQTFSAQFNFLQALDPLASPNRTYELLPQDFFISNLVKTLDNMTTKYGKKYIYGTLPNTSTDDKLLLIAKLLRYQNSPRTEKGVKTNVQTDMQETKDTFNINQKLWDTINQYLKKDVNQWAFLSPNYNETGYEVAFINSDGNDLIQTKDTPAFIQNLQTIKQQQDEKSAQANKLVEKTQTAVEQSIQNECGIDANGTALLFDIKTGKSPWLNALKCRWKKTASWPLFGIKINFKSALWPVLTDNYSIENAQELKNNAQERKWFGQEVNTEEKNQNTIDTSSPIIADKLREYLDTTNIKVQDETQYATQTNNIIQINSPKSIWPIQIRISGTGDVCLSLDTQKNSLCQGTSTTTLQGNKDILIKNTKKQAGTSLVHIDMCVPNTNSCVTKIIKIEQLPGAITKATIKIPTNIIAAWGQIPFAIQANDAGGNTIHQDAQNYTLSVNTGTLNGQRSIQINNFWDIIVYEAPTNIPDNISAIITLSWTNQEGRMVFAQQNIIIAKAKIRISANNQEIGGSSNKQNAIIKYNLPDNETTLIKTDAKGIPQIQKETLPKISIELKDKNGNKLDSIIRITSKQWLVTPGMIQTDTVSKQSKFQAQENAVITNGAFEIYLYPNFKVGTDEVSIDVPGIPTITIPVQINPGQAQKVYIQLDKENYSPQEQNKGKITVLDYWNNKIQETTPIKIWVIGPWTINNQESAEVSWTGNDIAFNFQTKTTGGEWYLFAYLKNKNVQDQTPGYQNFFVQKSILPETNLNVLYLNLFWTDRWNQRGYFSDNNRRINQITQDSEKVLISTTQLIDPVKLRQIQIIISPNGQIQNNTEEQQTLNIYQWNIEANIGDIATCTVGKTNLYKQNIIKNRDDIQTDKPNTLRYIAEPLDSTISGNTIKNGQLMINNQVAIDFNQGVSASTQIIADTNYKGLNTYDILRNDTKVGELYVIADTIPTCKLKDTNTYDQTEVFTEGSTNGQTGIWIYTKESAFSKNGYLSIEDSKDPLLGIGFTNKFKNITYFAQGKTVGESTLPYGSVFLINFWDPLIQRVSESVNIDKTDFDGGPGQSVFSDPNKTIFKAIPTDINNDGLQDIIIAYTDGSIKLAKNYGGKTNPYNDLQELMVIADSISDIKVGDTNGDGYPDIIIQTTQNKIIVYKNNAGVFDVDGTPVCLNTNQQGTWISSTPAIFDGVYQLFIEDMNKDGNLDIVTNEKNGDINIFYGGKDSKGRWTYISNQTAVCDSQRFERQKYNYQHIKRIWLQIRDNRFITDQSIVHRKNMPAPDLSDTKDTEEATDTTTASSSVDINAVTALVKNNTSYINNQRDLFFLQNPFEQIPAYESVNTEKITYMPIAQLSGDEVSIYKQYKDLNGGILQDNDKVQVTITIVSLKDNNKITYADKISWPRAIQRNQNLEIPSLQITGVQQDTASIYRNNDEEYLFMIDDISLGKNQSLQISYDITYKGTQTTTIQVEDKDTSTIAKDGYPDIIIQSTDACLKNRKILFNKKENSKNFKTYEEKTEDIQSTINTYLSGANQSQTNNIISTIQQTQTTNIDNLPGMSNISEQRSLWDLLSPWGASINLNMNGIDKVLAGVSSKLDSVLQGLCQWFSVGKNWCWGIPIPFNQAFLAPGDYHIFWCVPGPTSPLYPVFKTINSTLWKGIPIVSFPTNSIVPIWPPFPSGAGGIFWGSTSQFRLYIAPTMTMGIGFAICLWPYSLATKLPKPFRDLWGNCVVFATPAGGAYNCAAANTPTSSPGTKQWDEYDPAFVDAASNGACSNPPSKGNRIVFATENQTISTNNNGTSSPLQLVNEPIGSISIWWTVIPVGVANTSSTADNGALFPQGNFWGIVQLDQSVNQESLNQWSNVTQENAQEEFEIKPWEKTTLKIRWAQTKGLVKCLVKDWMTRQIQYVMNNLTKMSIQIDLPDVTQITQGFAGIPWLTQSYKQTNKATLASTGSFLNKYLSKQAYDTYAKNIGQNPFEAIMKMFANVPLINLNSKDINIKIPLLWSDEITKYKSYLQSRLDKNQETSDQRDRLANELDTTCQESDIKEAVKNYDKEWIESEINDLKQQLKDKNSNLTQGQRQTKNDRIEKLEEIRRCKNINNMADKFTSVKVNATQTIKAVQANIKVLEEYKAFPFQLYSRIHVTDRYLAETTSVLSQFTFTINNWLQTNANRYSQYVDAITLIIGAIKTRQAIINFSVNWSEKCSTCSNDSYGSFSCSLSFLCPQLPIFKIPAFKIPDIHLDLSHLEVGIDILLPKFNLVPIKIPLPQLPNIPQPPDITITIDAIDTNMPTIPILPGPPQLPELPSFIPNIELDLPVLPPAPKIPKIIPEIGGTLKIADFIGKIFCIIKWGIGLVGEKGVKGKIEQITQRTRNVPVFDFFDVTTKYKSAPLQGFDYKIDAYTRLKFNFEGIYTLIDNVVNMSNKTITENIERPAEKWVNRVNTGSSMVQQNVDSISNPINIQGFMQSEETGELAYADAYKKLDQWLQEFKIYAKTDKKTVNAIQNILQTIASDSKVTPAKKEIDEAERTTQTLINDKRKEIDTLSRRIEKYDTFISDLKKDTIQLVKDETTSLSISTPLMKLPQETKNRISLQEDPTKTYLDLNKWLIQGYLKALEKDGPEKLAMTNDTYNKSKQYLTTLQNNIQSIQEIASPSSKILLADASCPSGTCPTAAEQNAGYQPDISSYVQGIFVQTGASTGKVAINVVNNNEQSLQIGKKYVSVDINNDKQKDLFMRDQNTVYIKYAEQNNNYNTKGGNSLEKFFDRYYVYQGNFGKRRIDTLQDIQQEKWFAQFGDTEIKILDVMQEVKNFSLQGQNFESIQMGWKNSSVLGDKPKGYLIRYTDKIDNFFEKIQTFSFFGSRTTQRKYILVLPQDTSYETWLLSVDTISKKPIIRLLSGEITTVKYYDPNQEIINISLYDMPRQRIYAQIATLQDTSTQKSYALYSIASPRSNQIVAGNQILGDTKPPEGEIVLHRDSTNETISTGNMHQWYINTRYTLSAQWTDNVAVQNMSIEKNGTVIFQRTGTQQTWTISIPWLFFTGTTREKYIFKAIDANKNIAKEEVTINISIPKVEIVQINQKDKETSEIIAKIQNDIDEGMVTFQRTRNGEGIEMKWTLANIKWGYQLSPGQTIITGGIFSFWNTLGLYQNDGVRIGSLDPENGQISIRSWRENAVILPLDLMSHLPKIIVQEKTTLKKLFQISLPPEKLVHIKMFQWTPNYEVIQLKDKSFQEFAWWYCIKNQQNECIIYIAETGKIYIPGIYAATLQGNYSYNPELKTIQYTIQDEKAQNIATIDIKTQNLLP